MQKWRRTLVALAISSVQTITQAHVGLARAVVAAPRPTDPRFLAFVLQNVNEQRYSATVRYFDRTDTLMVFIRADYGLSAATKAALNPELTPDRPLTVASDMPTLALAAHEWKDRDSIIRHGLWKKEE